jgi:ribosomal protein S18 acetylase RimI-like enzyme
MLDVTIRNATMDDAERLFAWRNDPLTRQASHTTDPVAWEDHRRWLERALATPQLRLCVLEVDGEPAATCRFEFDQPETVFSFSVAPEFRLRGLSRTLMRVAVAAEPVHVSHVKRSNRAIQLLLESAGARLVDDGEMQLWRYDRDLASAKRAD